MKIELKYRDGRTRTLEGREAELFKGRNFMDFKIEFTKEECHNFNFIKKYTQRLFNNLEFEIIWKVQDEYKNKKLGIEK